MANKKLKVGGGENLKLPAKKDKTATKPKWQAKIGGRKRKPEPVVETPGVVADATPVPDSPTLPPEPTETPVAVVFKWNRLLPLPYPLIARQQQR
jgi:hypothetical protein